MTCAVAVIFVFMVSAMRIFHALCLVGYLVLCLVSSESVTESGSEINATATALKNGSRFKEDSFADLIDRALEKEFNETDQNESPY